MKDRIESDSMGPIAVPESRYWGAQTQRSLDHFDIGRPAFVWGPPMIRAFGHVKKAAAAANASLGVLDPTIAALIDAAADEVINGELDGNFPLVVFQTGSGTQTNMNVNEVLANRANELAGHPRGSRTPVHPNDHVNASQSSNDVFPTAMHVATVTELDTRLVPAVSRLREVLADKADAYAGIVKVGRTHLQDAVPITLGQEISGWVAQLDEVLTGIHRDRADLCALAIGATAVGTGLNADPRFGAAVCSRLSETLGIDVHPAPNLFAAVAAHDAMVRMSGSLRVLAGALLKIANDVRWLASGPRAGLGELTIPANEPGSSIMPGKVNPTQAEAVTMVVARVFGNDVTVGFAGSQGNFELNVFKPIIAHAVLESIGLLADACASFTTHCAIGIAPRLDRIQAYVEANLMMVTALAPHIGYDAAALIAKRADAAGLSLRAAALETGINAGDFDRWVVPLRMTAPGRGGSHDNADHPTAATPGPN